MQGTSTPSLDTARPTDSGTSEPSDSEPTDSGLADSGAAGTMADCVVGLEVGNCPPDFGLPDRTGAEVLLSDHRATRVAVVGTAEW